jgi:hypothetical protein
MIRFILSPSITVVNIMNLKKWGLSQDPKYSELTKSQSTKQWCRGTNRDRQFFFVGGGGDTLKSAS